MYRPPCALKDSTSSSVLHREHIIILFARPSLRTEDNRVDDDSDGEGGSDRHSVSHASISVCFGPGLLATSIASDVSCATTYTSTCVQHGVRRTESSPVLNFSFPSVTPIPLFGGNISRDNQNNYWFHKNIETNDCTHLKMIKRMLVNVSVSAGWDPKLTSKKIGKPYPGVLGYNRRSQRVPRLANPYPTNIQYQVSSLCSGKCGKGPGSRGRSQRR